MGIQLPSPATLRNKKPSMLSLTKMRKLRFLLLVFLVCLVFYAVIRHHIDTVGLPPNVYRVRQGILEPNLINWEEETSQFKPVPFFDQALLTPPGIKTPIIQSPNNNNILTKHLPSIPVNEIPVYPRLPSLPSNAPTQDQILFVMTTTPNRAKEYSQLWTHFLTNKTKCLVLLSPNESTEQQQSLESFLRFERNLNCYVRISNIDQYENRMLSLPAEGLNFAPLIDWIVIGDDDTTYLDIRLVQRMLAKYDPTQYWALGGTTESQRQASSFGDQAFGGAGIFFSNSLARQMSILYEQCVEEFRDEMGGDGKLSKCAALATGKSLKDTIVHENGLHQFDIPGNAEGFFQSGQPFISLHHLIRGWSDIIPSYFPKYMSEDWTAIKITLRAAKFLGGDNMFRRFAFDGGRTLVTLGHSVIVFRETLTSAHYQNIEHTWGWFPYPLIDELPERTHNKRSYEYFIKDIYPSTIDLSSISGYTEDPPANWDLLIDDEKDFQIQHASTVVFVYEEWWRRRTLKLIWDENRSDSDLHGDGQWFGQDWLDERSEYVQQRYQNLTSS